MRYGQDSLTIDTPQQQLSLSSGFSTQLPSSGTTYTQDSSSFYSPASAIFPSIDGRTRLSSNIISSASSSVMAHAHRGPTLPTPAYNTRDLYSRAVPSFPRNTDHIRSSTFSVPPRRHPLSPTPSPSIGFTNTVRMDSGHFGKSPGDSVPPLLAISLTGQLRLQSDPRQIVQPQIEGKIDKGFFMSDGEWTCYRRNYFSCVCSYSLEPYTNPSMLLYSPPNMSGNPYHVQGFAMSISAVVSETDSQPIDLVQHTPKRDKGPTDKPGKVSLDPKPPGHHHQPHPHSMAMYGDAHALGASRVYDGDYSIQGRQNQPLPTEHTFERIQFKQATANNGKRRAAQQYYHLLIELYVDIGAQGPDQYLKVAQRKSAKMIVRGRSPGHYQSDRRGSTGSGPGSASGFPGTQILGSDYGPSGSSMIQSPYGPGSYDPRPGAYSVSRHHDLPMEPVMSAAEAKRIENTQGYQYYPSTIYEGSDPKTNKVEVFTHMGDDQERINATGAPDRNSSKVKYEYENTRNGLMYNPGAAYYPSNCSRFEGKSSSAGYYPAVLS